MMGSYTKKLRTRAEMLGSKKEGFCVICGTFGKLHADHVPPKGCVKISDVILHSLLSENTQAGVKRPPIVQGGVKFKTICGSCNNKLLGTEYDPSLKSFVDDVLEEIKIRKGRIVLSPILQISVNSHRVARSLIGHILAAHAVSETEIRRDSLGANDTLRAYLLDPTTNFPNDWRLYCWPYFSRNQVILRHAALMDTSVNEPAKSILYGHVIKFLPLGFWFVHNQPAACTIHAYEITPPTETGIEHTEGVIFDLRSIPNIFFPENPVGNQVMLFADEQSSVAMPR